MSGSHLRILCVSDFHLTARAGERFQGVDVDGAVEKVMETAYRRGFSDGVADVIVMLGDVTQSHDYGDLSQLAYARAREYLVYFGDKMGKDTPVVYTYGNHDDQRMMDVIFSDYFTDEMRFCKKYTCCRSGWTLLALDTHKEDAVGGEVSQEELERLKKELENLSGYAIVLGHHPLKSVGARDLDNHVVSNGEEICELLCRDKHVVAYLNGHVHMDFTAVMPVSRENVDLKAGVDICDGLVDYGGQLDFLGVPSTSFQFKRSEGFIVTGEVPGWREIVVDSDGGYVSHVGRIDESDWDEIGERSERAIGKY